MMKIGITGHQNIGSPQVVAWVRLQLSGLVSEENATHGFTCLAIGADQLFAEILLTRGIPYTGIIPAKDYTTTFTNSHDLKYYKRLLECAEESFLMPFEHSCEEAFFEAGKEIVRRSDLLLAVWNGKPAKGLGGTADVVKFASELGKRVIHVNNLEQTRALLRA